MERRAPSPAGCCIFGSSRWLVQSEDGWGEQVQKLPQKILDSFQVHSNNGRASVDIDDWASAISEYETCRSLLLSGRVLRGDEDEPTFDPSSSIEKETCDWLLAWVDLPLALLLQYRAKRLAQACEIWKEILQCVKPLQIPERDLVDVVESFVHSSMYEWACSTDSPPPEDEEEAVKAKALAVRSHALLNKWDAKDQAEPHLCLLLSFDHYYFGSWQVALQWIQAAKCLWEQNLPGRQDYNHVFLRCEAELLIKLLKFEEAEALLMSWLETNAHLKSSPWHTDRVHYLVHQCNTERSWWVAQYGGFGREKLASEYASKAKAALTRVSTVTAGGGRSLGFGGQFQFLGLKFEDGDGNFLLSKESRRALGLPHDSSSTRLSLAQKFAQLAQPDTIGLDHHLRKLPLELGVAFCIHADRGRAALNEGNWEEAIVQNQMCRQMLKLARRGAMDMETHNWLLAWIDLPLARLYQYRARNFYTAFHIRREMLNCARPKSSHVEWLTSKEHTGLHHKITDEKMIRQMLLSIRPPNSVDEVADQASDEIPQNTQLAYLIRERRFNKSLSFDTSLAEALGLTWKSGPFGFLDLMGLERIFEGFCCITLYEWACAECPEMKDEVVTKYHEYMAEHPWLVRDDTEAEPQICLQLHFDHFLVGSPEMSWGWIQQAKEVLNRNLKSANLQGSLPQLLETISYNEAKLQAKLATNGIELKKANDAFLTLIKNSPKDSPTLAEDILPFQLSRQQIFADLVRKALLAGDLKEAQGNLRNARLDNKKDGETLFNMAKVFYDYSDLVQLNIVDSKEISPKNFHARLNQELKQAVDVAKGDPSENIVPTYMRLFGEMILNYQNYIQRTEPTTWDDKLPKDDEDFKRTVESIETCLELVKYKLQDDPLYIVSLHYNLATTHEHCERLTVSYFRGRAQAIMADNAGVNQQEELENLLKQFDIKSYLASTNSPVVEYSRQALLRISGILYHMTDRSSKSWILMQEKYKDLYDCLQAHFYRKYELGSFLHQLQGVTEKDPTCDDLDREKMKALAFLWSERQRARVFLFQGAGPNKLTTHAAHELRAFDTNDAIDIKEALDMRGSTLDQEVPTVFVEYSYEKKRNQCLIYIMNQRGDLWIDQLTELPTNDILEGKLKDLLTHMKFPPKENESCGLVYGDDEMHKDLEYFYDVLIRPIAHHLTSLQPEQKLIFAPNELFTKVPFAALRDNTKPPGQGYLVQSHTISLTPSLRVLKKCHDRLQILHKLPLYSGLGSVVAIGDPKYNPGRQLDPLESSGKEVEAIVKLFGETYKVKKLLGTDASAENLLDWAQKPSCDGKPSFRQAFIHIGAHGTVNWKQYNEGVLSLAKASSSPTGMIEKHLVPLKEDVRFQSGELTAEQISHGCKFEWASTMVVLSACNTAIGEISAEGVLSLARAFMMAGAPCVVASQWKVMDESTAALMTGFYAHLKGGSKDVASALRASMLDMIHNASYHVLHWSPFVVWGLPTVCLPHPLQATD